MLVKKQGDKLITLYTPKSFEFLLDLFSQHGRTEASTSDIHKLSDLTATPVFGPHLSVFSAKARLKMLVNPTTISSETHIVPILAMSYINHEEFCGRILELTENFRFKSQTHVNVFVLSSDSYFIKLNFLKLSAWTKLSLFQQPGFVFFKSRFRVRTKRRWRRILRHRLWAKKTIRLQRRDFILLNEFSLFLAEKYAGSENFAQNLRGYIKSEVGLARTLGLKIVKPHVNN